MTDRRTAQCWPVTQHEMIYVNYVTIHHKIHRPMRVKPILASQPRQSPCQSVAIIQSMKGNRRNGKII